MYHTIQPFVTLANANIAVFSRFVRSPEVAELAQEATNQVVTLSQENLRKMSPTNAFTEWTQALVNNYARFIQAYTQSLYGMAAQGRAFLSSQVEQGARRVGQLSETGTNLLMSSTEQSGTVVRNLADGGAAKVKQATADFTRAPKRAVSKAASKQHRRSKQATAGFTRARKGASQGGQQATPPQQVSELPPVLAYRPHENPPPSGGVLFGAFDGAG